MDIFDEELFLSDSLAGWVMERCEEWRTHYEANYESKFDEYYRLWRGIWKEEDKTRDSERSKIISPALQQAVESNVSELEEATFGRGKWFDISDNKGDSEREDVQLLRNKLSEAFEESKIRKSVAECLINAAVYGTGVAEIILTEKKYSKITTQPVMDGALEAYGATDEYRVCVDLNPLQPKNFLIEPVATSVEDALGCATDQYVSPYSVIELQEQGVYNDVPLGMAPTDVSLEADKELISTDEDKVRLTKYYGKVPRELLEQEGVEVEEKGSMVEAVVVIANGGILLKAQENPYMMQDRPIVAFPWDVVPNRFWGRGVCEKGYNSQKALDAELRARIDALGLTAHPMLAMDATRLPRGFKPEVRPGKVFLTSGPPAESLQPFNFGNVSQITFAQAQSLQQMVQQATGAVDSAGIAGQVNGEATAAGISMSLGAIIKRHKRTLINFQQSFLIPFVKKAAWRYMQFSPEEFPVNDYRFTATSTLGIIAREYEVSQLIQLLQTMPADSPLYGTLITNVIDNMNLSNREELISVLQEASQPSEQELQARQAAQEAEMQMNAAQVSAIAAQAEESQARAAKYLAEAAAVPDKVELDKLRVAANNLENGVNDDIEFERRLRIADIALKERDLNIKERQVGVLNDTRRTNNQPNQQEIFGTGAENSIFGAGSGVPEEETF